MLCLQLELCTQRLLTSGAEGCRERVHSAAEMARLIETITGMMAGAGHAEKDLFRVRLALEEAIVNAHKHGHEGDWTRPIVVDYHVSADGVVAEVEDQGAGFDPAEVADPLAPENLERSTGRGLFLMRTYMTGVCHNERGNRVCLCKRQLATC